MKRISKSRKGIVLVAVITVGFILIIIGLTLLKLAEYEYSLTHKDVRKMKAFYFAEAGIANYIANAYERNFDPIDETFLDEGRYWVDVNTAVFPPYAISTGIVGNEQKRIRVTLSFLSFPYEHAIFGGNALNQDWTLDLRGTGDPRRKPGTINEEVGGKDTIYGDVYAKGDVALYEQSNVNPRYSENYDIFGDVEATGNVNTYDEAYVSGSIVTNVDALEVPDLVAMNYEINHTHNVSQIFTDEGTNQGYLPPDHELYNVFVKNPTDGPYGRPEECASTFGDDYFLRPASINEVGTYKTAPTPLHLGESRIYYVDGNVWVHSSPTFGFTVDGTVTVVATGDIHISDNIKYADSESLLGLVALGKYDSAGQLASGGNIYFGDPRFGTTYTIDAFMFAANDFLYCTDSITGDPGEPETGFTVYGNFAGMNQVKVNRDWFTRITPDGRSHAMPAYYDHATGLWMDAPVNGNQLTESEKDSLRHYQMIVKYDERVRDVETQPPGLPKGPGIIFSGITYWEELPPRG